MNDFPVILQIKNWPVLIVGGGSVALRRAKSLLNAGADLTIISPIFTPDIDALNCIKHKRPYQSNDVKQMKLVVIATDDPQVNKQVADDAKSAGALLNRADDPTAGDFVVPAHKQVGPIIVSVYTSGISAAAGATIRDQLLQQMDPDWPVLLTTVAPYRSKIQQCNTDPAKRQSLLKKLTDPTAMQTLKDGGTMALDKYCQLLLDQC